MAANFAAFPDSRPSVSSFGTYAGTQVSNVMDELPSQIDLLDCMSGQTCTANLVVLTREQPRPESMANGGDWKANYWADARMRVTTIWFGGSWLGSTGITWLGISLEYELDGAAAQRWLQNAGYL